MAKRSYESVKWYYRAAYIALLLLIGVSPVLSILVSDDGHVLWWGWVLLFGGLTAELLLILHVASLEKEDYRAWHFERLRRCLRDSRIAQRHGPEVPLFRRPSTDKTGCKQCQVRKPKQPPEGGDCFERDL